MLTIEKVDTQNKAQVKHFVKLPHRLYKDCPQWVPLLDIDAYTYLNREKHPFHERNRVIQEFQLPSHCCPNAFRRL